MIKQIVLVVAFLLVFSHQTNAQQSAMTYQEETESGTSGGITASDILNIDQIWNDPSAQYRMLDPWRISAEFGGGIILYEDMAGETTQGGTLVNNSGEKFEDSAGTLLIKLELSALVSRSIARDWYFASQLSYEGRDEDDVIKIRGGTHGNEEIGFTLLNPLVTVKVLNRNQTSALTGIRVMSRTGQLAYQAAYFTGIASRKWFEEEMLWVNRIEFDVSFRFPNSLIGPFIGGAGDFSINSEEIARVEGYVELGCRYVNDINRSWLTQIDGYMYFRGGKWNDDTTDTQADESLGVIGAGARLRVWNLMLNMRVGYIGTYSYNIVIAPEGSGIGNIQRNIDGNGEVEFFMSLSVAF